MQPEIRKPDYIIKAWDNETDQKAPIGAVWVQDDGSLRLKFNPWLVLPTGHQIVITAWPNEQPRNEEADLPSSANRRKRSSRRRLKKRSRRH